MDINKLTQEQKAAVDRYKLDTIAAMMDTNPIDESMIGEAVKYLEIATGEKNPEVVVAKGPQESWNLVKKACGIKGKAQYIAPPFLGNHHAYLLLWAKVCEETFGHDLSHTKYKDLMRVSMPLHHVYLCKGIFIFSQRPTRIVRRGISSINGKVEGLAIEADFTHHCEDGPTLEYEGDIKTWHINGTRVDEQIVMDPKSQTIRQIDEDDDNDRRMIRIARFGWPQYLQKSGARVLDEGENAVEGTYEALFSTKHDYKVFLAVDPASDIVSLPVPSSIENCLEARKWFCGGQKMNVIGRV